MRTELQRRTARLNGAKSRGPVTATGKQRSSQNSRRHGLFAQNNPPAADFLAHYHAAHPPSRTGNAEYDRLADAVTVARAEHLRVAFLESHFLNEEIALQRKSHPEFCPRALQALAFRRLADETGIMRTLDRLDTTALRRLEKSVAAFSSYIQKGEFRETNPAAVFLREPLPEKDEICGTNPPLPSIPNVRCTRKETKRTGPTRDEDAMVSLIQGNGEPRGCACGQGRCARLKMRQPVPILCPRGTARRTRKPISSLESTRRIGHPHAFSQNALLMSGNPSTTVLPSRARKQAAMSLRDIGANENTGTCACTFNGAVLAVFLLALWAMSVASAATLQQLSFAQMTQSATAIVRARVTSSSASMTGRTIYTHYALQVSETWKGVTPTELVLPGGVAGGYRQSFPGVPTLQTGSEYVLYLWTSPSTGLTHIVGLSQGIFNVTQLADGAVQVGRARIGETMLDASGKNVRDQAIQMPLAQMKSQVQGAVSQ